MYQGLTATGIIINVSLITGKQLENKTTQTWTPNDSKHSHHYITCMQLYKQLKLWCEAAAGETLRLISIRYKDTFKTNKSYMESGDTDAAADGDREHFTRLQPADSCRGT